MKVIAIILVLGTTTCTINYCCSFLLSPGSANEVCMDPWDVQVHQIAGVMHGAMLLGSPQG